MKPFKRLRGATPGAGDGVGAGVGLGVGVGAGVGLGVGAPVTQERLASISEMLSARTRAAYAAAAAYAGTSGPGRPGVHRTATIVGMRQIALVNFDLLMEFELTVRPDGMSSYPAIAQQLISPRQARQLRPGLTLNAAADPSNPAAVWLQLDHHLAA